MKNEGDTILMTGVGSGIGKALAHGLPDTGNTIIITGGRLDALLHAAEGREDVHCLGPDVTDAHVVAAFAMSVMRHYPALTAPK